MAIENIYADSDRNVGKKAPSSSGQGAQPMKAVQEYEVIAGASNDSIYMLFTNVPKNAIITDLKLSHDAFGAGGLANLGIYESGTFTAKDEDVFGSAINISAAGRKVDGLENLSIEDFNKKLYEHAGDNLTGSDGSYDIGIKLTAVGATGSGTLTAELEYIEAV
jgi:hypothetical protein